jgi:hypothetical protein
VLPLADINFWHCPSARQQRISVMSKTITAVRSSGPRPIGGLRALGARENCRVDLRNYARATPISSQEGNYQEQIAS